MSKKKKVVEKVDVETVNRVYSNDKQDLMAIERMKAGGAMFFSPPDMKADAISAALEVNHRLLNHGFGEYEVFELSFLMKVLEDEL